MKNTVKIVICLSVVALLVIIVSIYRMISKTSSITQGAAKQVEEKKISDAKTADNKVAEKAKAEEKKAASEKAIETKKAADLKAAELKVIEDKKIAMAKAKNMENKELGYVDSTNERFAYSIKYPDNLVVESETASGNMLKSEDGKVSLQLYGSNNKDGDTIDSIYNKAIQNTNMYYKVKSGNWFVISYIEGDKIIYQKKVVGKASTNTFIFKFPTNEKDKYASVVDKLEKSFRTSSTDISH